MPPKAQAKTIETVPAPVLEADSTKDTKGADSLADLTPDKSDAAGEDLVNHPRFGLISWSELEEALRAENRVDFEAKAKAKAEAAKLEEDAKPAPICEACFPQGWDSSNAVGQDAVGCEHGSYARKQPAAISFPADWKSGEPTLAKE